MTLDQYLHKGTSVFPCLMGFNGFAYHVTEKTAVSFTNANHFIVVLKEKKNAVCSDGRMREFKE